MNLKMKTGGIFLSLNGDVLDCLGRCMRPPVSKRDANWCQLKSKEKKPLLIKLSISLMNSLRNGNGGIQTWADLPQNSWVELRMAQRPPA